MREVGAWVEKECGITYESRSDLIALLHRPSQAAGGIAQARS
jgi:hypothetical protein